MASFNHTSALDQPHDLAQRRSWVDSGPYWQDREARLGVRVGEPHKPHSAKPQHTVRRIHHLAAVRSDCQGTPVSLVPDDLLKTVPADLGLAEFHRCREQPSWQEHCIGLAQCHPSIPEFRSVNPLSCRRWKLNPAQRPQVASSS